MMGSIDYAINGSDWLINAHRRLCFTGRLYDYHTLNLLVKVKKVKWDSYKPIISFQKKEPDNLQTIIQTRLNAKN